MQIVKVSAGLAAILANLYCISMVIKRHHGADLHRKILISAVVGIPFGITALILGFRISMNLLQQT
ncbi:hypothetical protein WDW86_01715 [Bdellovibrionota bacterium FG-2]